MPAANRACFKTAQVDPELEFMKVLAAITRGVITFAVLSVLLIAARPAAAQTENVLYNFTGTPDGANPLSGVTFNNGNFYGTTSNGGQADAGSVYELSPNGNGGWTETILYSFCAETNCADGENPSYTNVVFDSQGNLYGSAYNGGANGDGVVYELSPSAGSWTETVLYSFAGSPDAANPIAGLIWDAAGNLYGTSYNGGAGDIGTVFELSPNGGGGWTEQVIASLSEIDAGLTMNSAGDIFGTTNTTVFELKPNGSGGWKAPTTLYTFPASGARGTTPDGTLVLDSSGNIYGTTRAGGGSDNGVIYKLTLGTTGKYTQNIIYGFGANGKNPTAGLVFDNSGNLYGTTRQGGKDGTGVVYKLATTSMGTHTESVLQAFTGENGSGPYAGLLYTGGYLYGTTYTGGSDGMGTVFIVNPAATATTTTISSYPNPSTNGDPVIFTATVTPAPPDGEVVIFEPIGQSTMTGGVATYTTSALPTGKHQVRAVYGGDLNFINSVSPYMTQVVDK